MIRLLLLTAILVAGAQYLAVVWGAVGPFWVRRIVRARHARIIAEPTSEGGV